jgi:hypothetical protein
MTIKRNGEKVILKGGKVSCSCCEEPEECCMYPADRLGVDYQAEDLPDSLAISDVEQGDFSGEWEKSDSGYQRDGYTLSVVNGQWVIEGFTRTITVGLCLIADVAQATILDQFADTYTASGVPAPGGGTESVSLSRISLCVWQGVDSCGGPVLLSYDGIASAGPLGTYHWYIGWEEYPFFNLFGCNSDLEAGSAEKTDPQSSPAGSYVNVNVNITVS